MKQEVFEARHADGWAEFERWIAVLSASRSRRVDRSEKNAISSEFPARYRQLCHHLSLARTRRYSLGLQQRLNQLALDGHQHLYAAKTPVIGAILRFFAHGFPSAFRRHWRFMALAGMLFYGPFFGMLVATQMKPDLVYSLIAPEQVAMMERMYDPENRVLGRERESEQDVVMFGHYIMNNISIGFRTYAGGLLYGIGSVFFLVFNGLYIGTVASHLTNVGYTETFWPFVAGHSAFELTAIVVFGAAGLMIGKGALMPGRRRRWHAIRIQALGSLPLVYGGGAMLVAAAFVEAFWSSTTWPPISWKYAIGALLWLLTALYFGLMGRNEP